MLTDISGNGFTILSNNFVGPIYTPPQLFQSGLTAWYDFNDRTTLFSDTGATVPIQNGDFIRYVVNKAPNRPLYDLLNSQSPLDACNSTVFCANTLNTNRNVQRSLCGNQQTGDINLRSFTGLTNSSTGKTAFTYSAFIRIPPVTVGARVVAANIANPAAASFTTSRFTIAINFAGSSNVLVSNDNNNNYGLLNVYITVGGIQLFNFLTVIMPENIFNGYLCATFVLENNRNYRYYQNNQLVSSGIGINTVLSGITLPIFRSTDAILNMYAFGNTQDFNSGFGSEVNEVVFSDGEALSEEQVYKLHQYYFHKYNIMNRIVIPTTLLGHWNT